MQETQGFTNDSKTRGVDQSMVVIWKDYPAYKTTFGFLEVFQQMELDGCKFGRLWEVMLVFKGCGGEKIPVWTSFEMRRLMKWQSARLSILDSRLLFRRSHSTVVVQGISFR